MSGVRLCRHYLPGMKAANWGRIIFISSESAVNIPVEMIHYGVTKTMQMALARGLAETTSGTGVTVNSILAGPTRSEGVEQFIADVARTKGIAPAEIEKDFFQDSETKLAPATLCHNRGSSRVGCVCGEPSFICYQRRGSARRRRPASLDPLSH